MVFHAHYAPQITYERGPIVSLSFHFRGSAILAEAGPEVGGGGLGPTLVCESLGGPISEVTSHKVRDLTQAFTEIYVFRMQGFGGRSCIGGRPGGPTMSPALGRC